MGFEGPPAGPEITASRGNNKEFLEEIEPELEIQVSLLEEIDGLICWLFEKSIEVDPLVKAAKQARLDSLFHRLGIKDGSELREIRQKVGKRLAELPSPTGYPTKEQFEKNLNEVMRNLQNEQRPSLPDNPQASDISRHGVPIRVDEVLNPRGRTSLIDYLYGIGKIMSSRSVYQRVFPEEQDQISVGPDWTVSNGRHRTATLRALKQPPVLASGMNKWVLISKD